MFTAYTDVLDYLFTQLPMYSRIGAAAYKDNLDNTIAICKVLNNPERNIKAVHIAGTNGKGSTSHIIAAILQSAGYKTGLYTSPHLKDFRERIRINGQKIPEQYIIDFVNKYKQPFETIEPSFFEWSVGLCYKYFEEEQVDIAVIETGLGGRLDSTNVITPLLSVITNIGYDHTDLLGNTLEKIAGEKAGIIKQNVPVVIGETHPETKQVFIDKALAMHAPILFADQLYSADLLANTPDYLVVNVYKKHGMAYERVEMQLRGWYQLKNLCTVIAAIEQLRAAGLKISDQAIYTGLAQTTAMTGLRGRWDILQQSPMVVADIAHNKDGITQLLAHLKHLSYAHLHLIIGFVREKDVQSVLQILPHDASYYFTEPSVPRKLPVADLAAAAEQAGFSGIAYNNVNEALKAALSVARPQDIILICGSNFVVADLDNIS